MNTVGKVNCNNQNVYVASLPRSGSTLLGMILNQHHDCFNIGESFYWAKLNPKNVLCTCGLKDCPILNSVYKKIKNDPDILNITNTITTIDTILQNGNSASKKNIADKYSNNIANSCNGFNNLTNIFREVTKKKIIMCNGNDNVIV